MCACDFKVDKKQLWIGREEHQPTKKRENSIHTFTSTLALHHHHSSSTATATTTTTTEMMNDDEQTNN